MNGRWMGMGDRRLSGTALAAGVVDDRSPGIGGRDSQLPDVAARGGTGRLGNTTTDLQIGEGQRHGFFNRDPWQTVILIAADRFLVQHGLLTGTSTLEPPTSGEKLAPAP